MNEYMLEKLTKEIEEEMDLTDIKCKCGENMYVNRINLLLSNPPQYHLFCVACNKMSSVHCNEYKKIKAPEDKVEKLLKYFRYNK